MCVREKESDTGCKLLSSIIAFPPNQMKFITERESNKHQLHTWDARTQLQSHRTRVQRGDVGRMLLTARRAASCHVDSPTRADVAQIGPYRQKSVKWLVQAETAKSSRNSKKKKKKR